MKSIRLSLILPFYGVEKYIRQCLESVYHQDIPEEEYEVICINDCSPDRCEEIVLTYQKQHANLRLIRHEQNLKLGAARNSGLRAATGSYVWFIDTDDYLQENCFGEILSYCEKDDLDIMHFAIQNNYGSSMRSLVETDVVTGIEEERISEKQLCIEITYPWNRIYRREFLLENNLFFNDLYGGDVIHTILAANAAKRVRNVNRYYHFYRVDNSTSDTHSPGTAEKLYKMNYVLGKAIGDILPLIDPSWRDSIAESVPWKFNQSWKRILRFPLQEQIRIYHLLYEDKDLLHYVLQNVDKLNKFVILCPVVVLMIGMPYKIAWLIRNNYKQLKECKS